jgi:sec-independent protein translocase protein TatB
MANLGMADSLILMVMALVVFGPRRLPQIGRQIGKLMYEFRKASNDFKFQMEEELRLSEDADRRKQDEERRRLEDERRKALELAAPKPAAPEAVAAESPYTSESMIPPPADAPAEPWAEESYPRIQPPSTGDPVAAERPNRYYTPPPVEVESATASDASAQAAEAFVAQAGIEATTDAPADSVEPVPADQTAQPEQAAHHA